jgi:hypothetical protein
VARQALTLFSTQSHLRFGDAGWRAKVDVTSVPAGAHVLEARARSRATGVETAYTQTITVAR